MQYRVSYLFLMIWNYFTGRDYRALSNLITQRDSLYSQEIILCIFAHLPQLRLNDNNLLWNILCNFIYINIDSLTHE